MILGDGDKACPRTDNYRQCHGRTLPCGGLNLNDRFRFKSDRPLLAQSKQLIFEKGAAGM
jgi:hypothetical protein